VLRSRRYHHFRIHRVTFKVIGTASTVCGRVYVTVRCPSVCLSVPAFGRCTARLQQARTPFYRHPRQHDGRQRMRAVSCCTLASEAEHRFVSPSKRRVVVCATHGASIRQIFASPRVTADLPQREAHNTIYGIDAFYDHAHASIKDKFGAKERLYTSCM